MDSIHSFYAKFMTGLDYLACRAVLLLLGIMLITVNMEIVSRSFFNYSMPWVEETAKYFMVWVAFIGGIPSMRRMNHPAITAVLDRLNNKGVAHKMLQAGIYLVSAGTLLSMGTYSVGFVQSGEFLRMTTVNLPMSYAYAAIPVGCVGMALVLIERLLGLFVSNAATEE